VNRLKQLLIEDPYLRVSSETVMACQVDFSVFIPSELKPSTIIGLNCIAYVCHFKAFKIISTFDVMWPNKKFPENSYIIQKCIHSVVLIAVEYCSAKGGCCLYMRKWSPFPTPPADLCCPL